ncbi:hypothetical protein [Rhizobium sp. SSA_523]|uniref:hypothetical protein n=1 Tax=Rhizobium sp. SSA_523 TaxID=2952477 RepID=UPI002090CCEB|nr:hypothetical protein [Rhizobium sp. SSA_523]MCO5733747.1 hypothetical protein [Rhizobium sp. SSA_523]WKC24979.1 hypothetical protein QTJ18_13315 [Rhizobium sp. SSA_523]
MIRLTLSYRGLKKQSRERKLETLLPFGKVKTGYRKIADVTGEQTPGHPIASIKRQVKGQNPGTKQLQAVWQTAFRRRISV